MRLIKMPVFQGHPLPSRPYAPQGPFNRDLLQRATVVTDYEPQPEGGGDVIPPGATAQNDFKPITWYVCRDCVTRLREADIATHACIPA